MSIYQVLPVGGGMGFKVQVAGTCIGLRVVGIFATEVDAAAWIDSDRAAAATVIDKERMRIASVCASPAASLVSQKQSTPQHDTAGFPSNRI
jgi:hypothetical protein